MAREERSGAVRPSWFWFLLLDGGIVVLTKLAVSKNAYDRVNEMSGDGLPPRETLQALLIGTVVVHAAEALAAGRMAKRRGLSHRGLEAADLHRRLSLAPLAAADHPHCLKEGTPSRVPTRPQVVGLRVEGSRPLRVSASSNPPNVSAHYQRVR